MFKFRMSNPKLPFYLLDLNMSNFLHLPYYLVLGKELFNEIFTIEDQIKISKYIKCNGDIIHGTKIGLKYGHQNNGTDNGIILHEDALCHIPIFINKGERKMTTSKYFSIKDKIINNSHKIIYAIRRQNIVYKEDFYCDYNDYRRGIPAGDLIEYDDDEKYDFLKNYEIDRPDSHNYLNCLTLEFSSDDIIFDIYLFKYNNSFTMIITNHIHNYGRINSLINNFNKYNTDSNNNYIKALNDAEEMHNYLRNELKVLDNPNVVINAINTVYKLINKSLDDKFKQIII